VVAGCVDLLGRREADTTASTLDSGIETIRLHGVEVDIQPR
jgi:hypothetical protein